MSSESADAALSDAGTILLIDDDPRHLDTMRRFLADRGFRVFAASGATEAFGLHDAYRPDVVLLDLSMPAMDGFAVLDALVRRGTDAGVILFSGFLDVATTVRALRAGADNVLAKPADTDHLLAALTQAMERSRLIRRHRALLMLNGPAPEVLDESPPAARLRAALETVARGPATVLLAGETGTGKCTAAQFIHRLSPWSAGPFIRVNCHGLPAAILDRELFGASPSGSGGPSGRRGAFELAAGGTLFLNEVGALPAESQPRLLAAIDGRRYTRLPPRGDVRLDVRVIASTSRDLSAAIRDGAMQAELFYRLSAAPITLPSLRARGADAIVSLGLRILRSHQANIGRGPTRMSTAAATALGRHPWPGNLRELRHVIELAVALAAEAVELDIEHLPALDADAPDSSVPAGPPRDCGAGPARLDELERRHIARVLAETGGNRSRAAAILGITRSTLYRKLREQERTPARDS